MNKLNELRNGMTERQRCKAADRLRSFRKFRDEYRYIANQNKENEWRFQHNTAMAFLNHWHSYTYLEAVKMMRGDADY